MSLEAQDGAGLPGADDYGCGSATMPNTDVVYVG
jgi:hypothetical protein